MYIVLGKMNMPSNTVIYTNSFTITRALHTHQTIEQSYYSIQIEQAKAAPEISLLRTIIHRWLQLLTSPIQKITDKSERSGEEHVTPTNISRTSSQTND
jgi:hypothetical protein